MSTWIISGWIHLAVGFAIGWLVFKRPEFITRFIAKIRAKVGL